MSNLDLSRAFDRIKLQNDFACEKKIKDVNQWGCKDCPYYYLHEGYPVSRCLKKEIKEWALYRTEVEK